MIPLSTANFTENNLWVCMFLSIYILWCAAVKFIKFVTLPKPLTRCYRSVNHIVSVSFHKEGGEWRLSTGEWKSKIRTGATKNDLTRCCIEWRIQASSSKLCVCAQGHPSFFRGVLSFGVCYSEIPPKVMRGKPIWEVVEQMLLQGTQQWAERQRAWSENEQ